MNMAQDRLKGRKTLQVANFLDEFEKDDIKKDVDIVRLFEHFGVTLAKKGKSFSGKCPWHDDRSPSLSVDRDKGLYNCFGCGESGDIFTLTEKMKGLNFRESVTYLKDFAGRVSGNLTIVNSPTDEDTAPQNLAASLAMRESDETLKSEGVEKKSESGTHGIMASDAEPLTAETKEDSANEDMPPAAVTPSRDMSLSTVADYYHKRLFDSPDALRYLESRGFTDTRLLVRFQVGFADGSIFEKLADTQKTSLMQQGIITDRGNEHFAGCITIPVFDDMDQVVGMYGRNINPKAKIPHLYLKGKHKSVFNHKASNVYDEIILAESIIDALSLIELGFENTQAVYGTNGFIDEHLNILKDDRVKTVIIAFDADEAGRTASEKLKEKLTVEGFSVKIITPPHASNMFPEHPESRPKDWNEYLTASGSREAIAETIDAAEVFTGKKEDAGFTTAKDHLGSVFTINGITYRVMGMKEVFISNLRVNIKAGDANTGVKYYDNLDLYSARSRSAYAANMGKAFDIEPSRVEKDLVAILEYLESERDRFLSGDDREARIIMSADEKDLGMGLLANPDMYREIVDDMTTLGYVGEEENKLLVWLAGVSRLLPKPMSVFIQSPPSTGKSFLLETLLKLLPEESAEWITSVSDQSFNYMDEGDFLDKIFMLGEALHNEVIEGYIRQMQSENRIARKVTVKDPKSGIMKTMTVKHDVRLVFMQTSTAMKVNIENLSRCLVLRVDNSREQTERVLAMQRYKTSYQGHLEEKHVIPKIMKKHHAAQRLLAKIPVFNPFERCIRFPSTRPIMRRGQTQFLGLITASCLARQMQKEPVEMEDHYTGKYDRVYECDYEDYATARRLFIDGKLLQQDEDLPAAAVRLYEEIRAMVRKKAKKEGLESAEVTFIQKDVRGITELGNESIKRYLRILVEYEYLQVVAGRRHGTRFSYKLREDAPIDVLDIASIIPTVEEVMGMMEEAKKRN
jgi:hypothetical protein